MIQLSSSNALLEVDLEKGGRIEQLTVNNLNLLIEKEDNPLAWGCYPMIPWVGRLKEGCFEFKGKQYSFPLNMVPNAIHGTCFDRAWNLQEQSETQLIIQTDLGEHWPFEGFAQQTFQLEENKLRMEISVHCKQETFPAFVGWHPWFKRQLEKGGLLQLDFEAEHQYDCDQFQIPNGALIAPKSRPWDDCFTDIKRPPKLTWPGALELSLVSSCDHWVVYDMPEHAICVEPQSAEANALNSTKSLQEAHLVTAKKPLVHEASLMWKVL